LLLPSDQKPKKSVSGLILLEMKGNGGDYLYLGRWRINVYLQVKSNPFENHGQ
jgi:hypothetical protein